MIIAADWFRPETRIERMTSRLTTELREVKSLPIDASAPIMIKPTVARPNSGVK